MPTLCIFPAFFGSPSLLSCGYWQDCFFLEPCALKELCFSRVQLPILFCCARKDYSYILQSLFYPCSSCVCCARSLILVTSEVCDQAWTFRWAKLCLRVQTLEENLFQSFLDLQCPSCGVSSLLFSSWRAAQCLAPCLLEIPLISCSSSWWDKISLELFPCAAATTSAAAELPKVQQLLLRSLWRSTKLFPEFISREIEVPEMLVLTEDPRKSCS